MAKTQDKTKEKTKFNRDAIHAYVKHPRALGLSWSVPGLLKAYNWPTGLPVEGSIAIIELGGGWIASDLAAFFAEIGQVVPNVTDVSVDGTTNLPVAGFDSPDYEVALDIEIAAAGYQLATGKQADIRVYWAQDITNAIAAAQADGCTVCSISWGADEAEWGEEAANALQTQVLAAVDAGMIVFAASGDNDSSDGGASAANVDLPASAPNVIGCGGTTKTMSSEVVWNNNPGNSDGSGTGGGFSTLFPTTSWKPNMPTIKNLGRMVPDVAANADPNTGYRVYVHGAWTVLGGTSAVAPLYAGLVAACKKRHGVGFAFWENPDCFTDITVGNNGTYSAEVGPDACTGLGVLKADLLAEMLNKE
jgi:kumamolisin